MPPQYAPPPYDYGYGQPPEPPRRRTERRSTAMMATGIVSISLGGILATVGVMLMSSAENSNSCYYGDSVAPGEYYYPDSCVDEDRRDVGLGLAIGGLVGVAVGIPLTIVGAKKVPVKDGKDPDDEARIVPEVLVSPTGAILRWQF